MTEVDVRRQIEILSNEKREVSKVLSSVTVSGRSVA